jgi:hypothetical protein
MFQKRGELVAESEQKQHAEARLCPSTPDSANSLCGVRCIISRNDRIYAGLQTGLLNVLNVQFKVLRSVCAGSIMCMAIHPTIPLLATGGDDGCIRLYNISSPVFNRPIATQTLDNEPIVSIVFTQRTLAAASARGLHFASLVNCEIFGTIPIEDPILAIAYLSRPNLVVVGCQGRDLLLISPDERRIFRLLPLSVRTYPLAIAVHPTDLLIVVAMSDSSIIGIDPISGESVFQFQTLAGIITRITFHDSDIILGSQAGFLMRWNLPNALRIELSKEPNAAPSPMEELGDEEEECDAQIRFSFIQQPDPPPEWVYKEDRTDLIAEPIEESPEEEEPEEKAPDPQTFDAPRPEVKSEVREVEDFLRQSFTRLPSRDLEKRDRDEMLSLTEALRSVLGLAREYLAIRNDDPEVIEAQR